MIMIFNFIVKQRLLRFFIRIPAKGKSKKKPHTAGRRKYATVTLSPETIRIKGIFGDTERCVMQQRGRKVMIGLLLGLGVLGGVLIGGHGLEKVAAVSSDPYAGLESFTDVLAIVQRNYVEEVPTQKLVDGAINGMLTALDPHSLYLTPESYKELQVDTEGSFGGLGIEITLRDGLLTVVAPIEDTPAYRAGVKAGDQIIKIEGELTKDMSLVDAVKKMRGPKGSKITIAVRREGTPRLIDFTLTREVIKVQSVKAKSLENGYGYVRLTQFQDRSGADL